MTLKDFISVGQKIELTVWKDEADEGTTFQSYIKDVTETQFLVDPAPNRMMDVNRRLLPGVVVAVQFLTQKRDHILCYPKVESVKQSGLVGFWLDMPDTYQYEMQNRRQHVRIWMIIPVNIQFQGRDGKMQTITAHTQNVSGGGMRFVSDYPFLTGETLKVQFKIDESAPALDLPLEVIFVSENSDSTKSSEKYVVAGSFKNISSQQEGLIMQECFRKELRLKKDG